VPPAKIVNQSLIMQSLTQKMWCGLAVSLALCAPAFAQKEPGDLWEIKSEVSGMPTMPDMPPGMAMPGATQLVCMPRHSEAPPGAGDDARCEMRDVKRSANRMTWKAQCHGTPPSSVSGETIYEGNDRFTSKVVVNSEGRTMTMKETGRRISECDAGAAKRHAAARQQHVKEQLQQTDDLRVKACEQSAQKMSVSALKAEAGMNCAPKYKEQFCRRLQTDEGFANLNSSLEESSTFCGIDGNALQARMCRAAEAAESLDLLVTRCLSTSSSGGKRTTKQQAHGAANGGLNDQRYGAAIAQRECAGRDYSSPPAAKYREFCTAYGRAGLMAGDERAGAGSTAKEVKPIERTAAEAVQEQAVAKGKSLLKGLLGRARLGRRCDRAGERASGGRRGLPPAAARK
jgi:hypothetical protein